MDTLSIIVPTIGRPTLSRTLQSLLTEVMPGDEIIVVNDGPADFSVLADLVTEAHLVNDINNCRVCGGEVSLVLRETSVRAANWGATPRNEMMPQATGRFLAFLDDDDIWLPGAREAIRNATRRFPSRPNIFRIVDQNELLLWQKPERAIGNVSTQMFVVPNDPAKLGTWGNRYEGDFDFIMSCKWDDVIWHSNVIAVLRPKGLV